MEKEKKERNPKKKRSSDNDNGIMTFGEHLEVLRRMLFRIILVVFAISSFIFCFKDKTFEFLLAPSNWDFVTYRYIEIFMHRIGSSFIFNEFHVNLIATELSSQFMTHITTALYLGLLGASPYIIFELFRFITPALQENERKYSVKVAVIVYLLFVLGVLMSYYILFPISFRFLGTYSVSDVIESNITISSYISTFTTLTLVMGLVFQLPVIAFFLGKLGIVTSVMLKRFRKYALIVIMLVAAIITPPDVMTLILVTIPLYLLYEISQIIIKRIEKKQNKQTD